MWFQERMHLEKIRLDKIQNGRLSAIISVRHWRWSGGPRPPEIMPDHQNIQTQWSDGPPKFSALSKIVTWPKNRSNRRHSRPIIQETRYRSRPFSRNKTSVNNHAGHELLRSRLTIRSRPFYGTKDVFIIMRDMNYWGRDRPSTQLT